MKIGDLITGTEGKAQDYVVVATSGSHFKLAVKPIVTFIPHHASFGFGLRFRAVSDGLATDPNCHGMVWNQIPFNTLKPTHASATVMTHALPAKRIATPGNAESLVELMDEEDLFKAMAAFVDAHVDSTTPDLTQLDGDAITQGLRDIMIAKLKAVEGELAHGGAPTPDPESTDIETKDAAEFDAFADWALGGLGGKGNGGGQVH